MTKVRFPFGTYIDEELNKRVEAVHLKHTLVEIVREGVSALEQRDNEPLKS